jgi:hypothetical protein
MASCKRNTTLLSLRIGHTQQLLSLTSKILRIYFVIPNLYDNKSLIHFFFLFFSNKCSFMFDVVLNLFRGKYLIIFKSILKKYSKLVKRKLVTLLLPSQRGYHSTKIRKSNIRISNSSYIHFTMFLCFLKKLSWSIQIGNRDNRT